jgi:hypothetical protein
VGGGRRAVELWSCGAVELWSCGAVELWSCGAVEPWSRGAVEPLGGHPGGVGRIGSGYGPVESSGGLQEG